jgi:hypothetical protein
MMVTTANVKRILSMMPLPRLKVLRETYCSQQVVDTAVDFVEVHRPELIEKLMAEEHCANRAIPSGPGTSSNT